MQKNNLAVLRNPKFLFWAGLLLLAAAAIATILYATRMGAALSDDSYYYVKPARDLLAGRAPGFSPHYPPLVPLLVAAVGLLGIEPLQGIRLLNAGLFGLNVLLAGWAVYRLSGSRGAGLAGAVLFFSSQTLLEDHAWAMSEALYITWLLALILALGTYFRDQRLRSLALAGVIAGCAALTRYSGLGLIAGAGLAVLLTTRGHWLKVRARNAVLFGALSGLLFLPYLVVYGDAFQKIRSFEGNAWVWLGLPELSEGFYNVLLWLMPGRLARGHEALVLGAIGLACGLAGLAYALLRRRAFLEDWARVRRQPLFLLILCLVAANLFTLYQARISPVYRSPFDARLLSPTHVLFLLGVCGLLGLSWTQSGRVLRAGIVLLLAWGLFLYAPRSLEFVNTMHAQGAGFANAYWTGLDAAPFFQKNAGREIITTAPLGIYFSLGLETPGITPMNPDQLRQRLKQTNGFLVVFNSMPLDLYGFSSSDFLRGLVKVDEYSDCTVYQAQ